MRRKSQSGFTLVELTAAIVIMGVLASVAVGKMAAPSFFERYAVAESISGLIQSAKITAASSECNITIAINNNGVSLSYTDLCSGKTGVVHSSDGQQYKMDGGDVAILSATSSMTASPLGIVSPQGVILDFDNGEKVQLTIDTMTIQ